jgi:hypothetical protein
MAFNNLGKTDMALIYGELRVARQSAVKGFLKEYFPMHEPL